MCLNLLAVGRMRSGGREFALGRMSSEGDGLEEIFAFERTRFSSRMATKDCSLEGKIMLSAHAFCSTGYAPDIPRTISHRVLLEYNIT